MGIIEPNLCTWLELMVPKSNKPYPSKSNNLLLSEAGLIKNLKLLALAVSWMICAHCLAKEKRAHWERSHTANYLGMRPNFARH